MNCGQDMLHEKNVSFFFPLKENSIFIRSFQKKKTTMFMINFLTR